MKNKTSFSIFTYCIITFILLSYQNKLLAKKLLLSNTPTIKISHATEILKQKRKVKIALFDTARREKYNYQPILEIAEATGFYIDYYSIGRLLDTPQNKIQLEEYSCVFFVLSPEFLKTMTNSHAAKKILTLIKNHSSLQNKMTCLMFPSIKISHPAPILLLKPLFEQLGININTINIDMKNKYNPTQEIHPQAMFIHLTNHFLQFPIETRSFLYHTTLKNPTYLGQKFNATQTIKQGISPVALLPIKQDNHPKEIKTTFPFGIYWFNNTRQNHLIIGNTSILSFSGISENFQLCPMEFFLRKSMHNAINEMMWEVYQILTQDQSLQGINTKNIFAHKKKNLPLSIQSIGTQLSQKTLSKQNPHKVAWMDIGIFDPANKTKDKRNQQKLLIHFIYSSEVDNLWITLNPHMYFSPIGKLKDQKNNFLISLAQFTKQLKKDAKKQGKKPPSIMIGFEITNNLYKPNLPTQIAWDLYGNSYPDIPRPLDETFWNNEIKHPLKEFLKEWENPKTSNGIKLSGIILDLEMYCRKSTGTFLPTMGFEPETISQFLRPPLSQSITPQIFTKYLMDNRLVTKYFTFLEKNATKLGSELRKFFNKKLPEGIISCYAPNISIDWFYKGLYRGLSTTQKPIYLFTFNSEFTSHKQWLNNNNIQTNHSGVLMLSKLQTQNDLKWIKHILNHHDGIWLNRFSRLVEPAHNDWSNLEQCPADMKKRLEFTDYLATTSSAF